MASARKPNAPGKGNAPEKTARARAPRSKSGGPQPVTRAERFQLAASLMQAAEAVALQIIADALG